MLFNSLDFAIFLPIVFILYWFFTQKNLKLQNTFIVIASYFFYGWWSKRFLVLILFSTVLDYFIGRFLTNSNDKLKRKLLLIVSLSVNLGFLGYFKYYNFFLDNFIAAFSFFGAEIQPNTLNIILPVGISFYTFQTLSYSIDVYRRKLKPTKDFMAFAAFVSFFPQLVAGPIERASNLLPQFYKKRKFEYTQAIDGMRQILWGLFKKVVIADNCAQFADMIFNNYTEYSGGYLVLGAIFFAFQIYGDFSGYSDIAIGTSRLFGFNLKRNFAFPYFSRDIAEFWRRWHISLSTWFRDYLYIPLGGSKGGTWKKIRNVFIIFIVSGFWHGANWTFIIWGALNAIYFIPLLLTKKNRKNTDDIAPGKFLPSIKDFLSILLTFTLVVVAWVFFRSQSVSDAIAFLIGFFNFEQVAFPPKFPLAIFILIFIQIFVEWIQRSKQHGLEMNNSTVPGILRWVIYVIFSMLVLAYLGKGTTFIYFQF